MDFFGESSSIRPDISTFKADFGNLINFDPGLNRRISYRPSGQEELFSGPVPVLNRRAFIADISKSLKDNPESKAFF